MNDHIKAARTLLAPVIVRNPIGMEPEESLAPPNSESVALAQAHATAAMAEELRIQNLIACSQRVFIRDAPDAIREHFGEAALGAPEFDQAATVAEFHGHLRQGLEEYFTDTENRSFSLFADLDDGEVGVDGKVDLTDLARFLAGYMVGLR